MKPQNSTMAEKPDVVVSIDLGTTFTGGHPFLSRLNDVVPNRLVRRGVEDASDTNPGYQRLARQR